MTSDIADIVAEFGATEEDSYRISMSLQSAIQFDTFVDEIPLSRSLPIPGFMMHPS